MVYSYVRRESTESLLKVLKNDETRPVLHVRHKSDSLIDFSPKMSATYEGNAHRNKSPSRKQLTRENRVNSVERKSTLVKRKSKDHLTKGNLFVPVSDTSNDKFSCCHGKYSCCCENRTSTINSCECDKSMKKIKSIPKKLSKSTILFDAVLDDDFALLRKLIITDEFDVDEVNLEGNTGLHFAAAAGHLECMQLLIDCGSRINAVDDYLRTPLEYAVIYGNFDCASKLIANGADTSLIKDGIL